MSPLERFLTCWDMAQRARVWLIGRARETLKGEADRVLLSLATAHGRPGSMASRPSFPHAVYASKHTLYDTSFFRSLSLTNTTTFPSAVARSYCAVSDACDARRARRDMPGTGRRRRLLLDVIQHHGLPVGILAVQGGDERPLLLHDGPVRVVGHGSGFP